MGVTEGEPEIFVPRCGADDRERIRFAGAFTRRAPCPSKVRFLRGGMG
jgi:hypothetical protein